MAVGRRPRTSCRTKRKRRIREPLSSWCRACLALRLKTRSTEETFWPQRLIPRTVGHLPAGPVRPRYAEKPSPLRHKSMHPRRALHDVLSIFAVPRARPKYKGMHPRRSLHDPARRSLSLFPTRPSCAEAGDVDPLPAWPRFPSCQTAGLSNGCKSRPEPAAVRQAHP